MCLQSLGVLLYYMCFQQLPFQGDCKLQVTRSPPPLCFASSLSCSMRVTRLLIAACRTAVNLSHGRLVHACAQVLNGDFSVPGGRPEAFTSLIQRLLRVAPRERPDIDAVLHELERLSSDGVPSRQGNSAALAGSPADADGRHGNRPGDLDNGNGPATHGKPHMPGIDMMPYYTVTEVAQMPVKAVRPQPSFSYGQLHISICVQAPTEAGAPPPALARGATAMREVCQNQQQGHGMRPPGMWAPGRTRAAMRALPPSHSSLTSWQRCDECQLPCHE